MDLVDKGAEKEIVKIMMNPDAYKVQLLILVTNIDDTSQYFGIYSRFFVPIHESWEEIKPHKLENILH